MKTFQIADFTISSKEYVSKVEENGLWYEIKHTSNLANSYLDIRTYGKVKGGKLGTRQQDAVYRLRDELMERIKIAMREAGWKVSDTVGIADCKSPHVRSFQWKRPPLPTSVVSVLTSVQPSNGNVQDSVTDITEQEEVRNEDTHDTVTDSLEYAAEPEEETTVSGSGRQEITVGSYTRTISTKSVTIKCARCGQTITKNLYPSPKPMYCGDTCKKAVVKEQTKLRVQRLRASRKQATK